MYKKDFMYLMCTIDKFITGYPFSQAHIFSHSSSWNGRLRKVALRQGCFVLPKNSGFE